jgi:ATP-dependent DNA ligase
MEIIIPELAHPIDYSEKACKQIKGEYRIEHKWDGIRFRSSNIPYIQFLTRSKRDITKKLLYLKREFEKFPQGTVLDGELTLSCNGKREELGDIQRIIGSTNERANKIVEEIGKPIYRVFDVLYWEGEPVFKKPLIERVKYISKYISNLYEQTDVIKPVERICTEDVDEAFKSITEEKGGEGIVIKDLSKSYTESFWLRKKAIQTIDFVVKGFNPGGGRYKDRVMTGSLIGFLFDPIKQEFVRVANIYGLSDVERANFYKIFTKNPDMEIVVECKYAHRFPSGGFRFCSFQRIREDKRADECIL